MLMPSKPAEDTLDKLKSFKRGASLLLGRQVNIGKDTFKKKAARKVQIKVVDHVSIN